MPAPPRYRLPKDLAGALSRLDDSEIDELLVTVTSEAKRRGRRILATAGTLIETKPADAARLAIESDAASGRPARALANEGAPSLTLGQTNAVRAAFMAGVKPSTIARQFGISQATVRQALGSEQRGRKK